jgi:hypothetical protein
MKWNTFTVAVPWGASQDGVSRAMRGDQRGKNSGKLKQREEMEHRPSPRASFSLKAHDISASSLSVAGYY